MTEQTIPRTTIMKLQVLNKPASSVALNLMVFPTGSVIPNSNSFPISYSHGWLEAQTQLTVGGTPLLSDTCICSKLIVVYDSPWRVFFSILMPLSHSLALANLGASSSRRRHQYINIYCRLPLRTHQEACFLVIKFSVIIISLIEVVISSHLG